MLGTKLKNLRLSAGISQKELADRLHISKSIVSAYENGDRYPSYDVLIKISQIFHVTTDYLLDATRSRVVDVSSLSDEDFAVVCSVIDALKRK